VTMRSVERALDVALVVIRNGGSTAMADRTFENILRGFRQDSVSTSWRLDAVAATSRAQGVSVTTVRPIGAVGVNLVRALEAAILGDRVARREVDVTDLESEVERINALPPSYNRWTTLMAAASIAAVFSQLAGGDWGALGIAFVAAGVGQLLRGSLQARKLPVAPVHLICGMLSASVAALGLRLGLSQAEPATAVASVVYMVPGLALINGFLDVVSRRYLLVGMERIADAAFLFLILALAIAFADTVVR
jgi:uncharacterized membrane protein YjjP (DUF1212 family)